MKKLVLCLLSILVATSAMQSVLGMDNANQAQQAQRDETEVRNNGAFRAETRNAQKQGTLAGFRTSLITGAGACTSFVGGMAVGNYFYKTYLQLALQNRAEDYNLQSKYNSTALGGALAFLGCNYASNYINTYFKKQYRTQLKQNPQFTKAERRELENGYENNAILADAACTSVGLATIVGVLNDGDAGRLQTFCASLPFIFAGVTALKFGSSWAYNKLNAKPKHAAHAHAENNAR